MFPCHLGLLLLVSKQRLGDLAGHGSRDRSQVLFRDAPFPQVRFGRQSRCRLMVVVVRVGDVYSMWVVMVEMEVMVGVAIGGHPWGYTQRGWVTTARSGLERVQNFRLGDAVAYGEVGTLGFLCVRGPGLAARHRVQGVGSSRRLGGGLGEVALAQRGDATAGAAGQGGVTAIQARLWTGGWGRYRVQGRLVRKGKAGFYIQYIVSITMFKCKISRITLRRPKSKGAQSTSWRTSSIQFQPCLLIFQWTSIKGIVYAKITIMSSFTHP